MKAITISVVQNGYLVQGYPSLQSTTCYEPPLSNNLFVFNNIEDLVLQLPKMLDDYKLLKAGSNIPTVEEL